MPKREDYLYNSDELICDSGSKMSKYSISKKIIKFNNEYLADVDDNIAGTHLKFFGKCSRIDKSCQLESSLRGTKCQWINYRKEMKLLGKNNLTKDSTCLCPLGGKIKFNG